MNAQEDTDLLQRIAREDQAALGILYDQYGRLVYSIACQILSDEALAEEVAQDVFIQIWNKASTYNAAQGKVLTWLTSITRHRAIDMYRRRRVRPEGSSVTWEECCDDHSDESLAVEPQLQEIETRHQLQKALASLPKDQSEALALAYFKGLTQQEIAIHLNQPLGTVKTRVRLALLKLRAVLSPDRIHSITDLKE
jgi:RNA polymerase sigma-70 factor, ECF subfamily